MEVNGSTKMYSLPNKVLNKISYAMIVQLNVQNLITEGQSIKAIVSSVIYINIYFSL